MQGTSGDVFSEYLVKSRLTGKNYAIIAAALILAVVLTGVIFAAVPGFMLILVLLWAGVYFVIKMQKTEYEYTFTSGDLDIDQLSGDFKRKRKATITSDTVEIIAHEKSDALAAFGHGQYKVYDFSSHNPAAKNRYVIIATVKNEKAKVIFEPNEKMIDNMWRYFPSKVKRV